MSQTTRNTVNRLLAARLGKAIFRASDALSEILRVPAKHRRTVSTPFSEATLKERHKLKLRKTTVPCRTPDPLRLSEIPEIVRTASTPATTRMATSRRSQELRRNCVQVHSSLKRERRTVQRQALSIHKGLHKCSLAVTHALRIDINGYLPKALIVHRGKLSTPSSPVTMRDRSEKQGIIKEYRIALVRKALAKGNNKDARYLYTFGSCSTRGT